MCFLFLSFIIFFFFFSFQIMNSKCPEHPGKVRIQIIYFSSWFLIWEWGQWERLSAPAHSNQYEIKCNIKQWDWYVPEQLKRQLNDILSIGHMSLCYGSALLTFLPPSADLPLAEAGRAHLFASGPWKQRGELWANTHECPNNTNMN